MADNTPAPYNFDAAKFEAKLVDIKETQLKFQGKHNHNPFKWIADKVLPLETRYVKGERTKELYDAVFNLKVEAPKINPNLPDVPAGTPASPTHVNPVPVAAGLTGLKK